MDTRTLVVGQRVFMVSGLEGPYSCDGMVVEVTDSGVTVQTFAPTTRVNMQLLHFDSEGKGLPFPEGTYECGPWYLTATLAEDWKW
jgi:hypothetical protein